MHNKCVGMLLRLKKDLEWSLTSKSNRLFLNIEDIICLYASEGQS